MIFLKLSDEYHISALKDGITLSNNFILLVLKFACLGKPFH